MKFLCPTCWREEEIIGDQNPRCRFCRVEMLRPWKYSEVWMSPCFVIDRMEKITETYGRESARRDRRFKREREAWTTAMLALALRKLTSQEWWVEIETVENTPDTKLQRINQDEDGNIIDTFEVEVVDWVKNVVDIMEVIGKKCARAYSKKSLLLVNARSGKLLDFDRVIEELKTLRSPFLEVWIIAPIQPGDIKVVRVAPPQPFVDLTREDFQNARTQKEFMKRGTRGTNTEFEDLGLGYLPIP